MLTVQSEPWQEFALCRGIEPNFFFPTDARGVVEAKKICNGCAAVDPCLEYALRNNIDHGVWGGTSERQRRRIRKRWLALGRVFLSSQKTA